MRIKIAVSALAGLFVTLGLVWQADAFFSRDQWAAVNNGGAVTQAVVNNSAPAVATVTGGGNAVGSIASGGGQPTVVNPEPSTVLLLASGLVAMGLWRKKQKSV